MESNIFMDTLSSQAAAKWQEKRIKKLNKTGVSNGTCTCVFQFYCFQPKPSPTQTKVCHFNS